jgi:uncharacterized membrane protein HdeD (DUF308 family)
MSTNQFRETFSTGIHEIRNSWGWVLSLGILLILCGAICVVADVSATFVTVFGIGCFLLISGVIVLIQAFRVHNWSGFFLYLLSALIRLLTGYLLVRYPGSGAFALTLVLASFFIVSGVFRAIGAGMLKFPAWGWSVASGIVSLVLGALLLAAMPVSSLWFIGFAIGIDMIIEGVSLVGLSSAIHHLPQALAAGT